MYLNAIMKLLKGSDILKTLLDALNEGVDTSFKPQAKSNEFVTKLPGYIKNVVDNYVRYDKDLNVSIKEMASIYDLNDNQIQRIIEGANNQVYLIIYEKMKHSPQREVKFNIASMEKIKGTEKENPVYGKGYSKVASKMQDSLEKTASEKFERPITVISNTSPAMKFIDNTDQGTEMLKKMAFEYQGLVSQIEKCASNFMTSAYTLSDSIITSHMQGYDHQGIYDYVSKKADMSDMDKQMFKIAFEERLDFLRGDRPAIYGPIKLSLDFKGKELLKEAFSLGERSMSKLAEEMAPAVPVVQLNKKNIKSINDLVNLAGAAKAEKASIDELTLKKNELAKKAKFTDEMIEKIATGKGVKAFAEALTGINAMKTRGALKSTTKELNSRINSEAYQTAKAGLEAATKSAKNPYTDPRMSAINNIVRDKAVAFQNASTKADAAINTNMSRQPLERILHPIDFAKDKVERLNRSAKSADLNISLKAQDSQAKRIGKDSLLTSEDSLRNLETVKGELGIGDLSSKIDSLSNDYTRAVKSRRTARLGTAAVAGAGSLAYNDLKTKSSEPSYPVF